jgi:hypothetical protein
MKDVADLSDRFCYARDWSFTQAPLEAAWSGLPPEKWTSLKYGYWAHDLPPKGGPVEFWFKKYLFPKLQAPSGAVWSSANGRCGMKLSGDGGRFKISEALTLLCALSHILVNWSQLYINHSNTGYGPNEEKQKCTVNGTASRPYTGFLLDVINVHCALAPFQPDCGALSSSHRNTGCGQNNGIEIISDEIRDF